MFNIGINTMNTIGVTMTPSTTIIAGSKGNVVSCPTLFSTWSHTHGDAVGVINLTGLPMAII